MDMFDIDYNEQMLNYYPEIIKAIREFRVLVETQSIEVTEMHKELTNILSNAYISTADEVTIKKWERMLGIIPLPQGEDDMETWLEDRRETILARLYTTEKLNTKTISDIVSIFTGGIAVSYFKDNTVNVLIYPPAGSKQFKFENVEQELRKKIPAHLQFNVERNYYTWSQIVGNHATWQDVKSSFANWEEVLLCSVL